MPDKNTSPTSSPTVRPGQERFVIADDEIGLGAVDAVADESAPASVWLDAWRQLRRRPIFWAASVLIAVAVLFSLVPGLIAPREITKIGRASCRERV